MIEDTFAAFILSHGRADNVVTYGTLKKAGYTGKIVIVIDDEDEQGDEYRKIYGDKVYTFSKEEAAKYTDVGDLTPNHHGVVYARNTCHKIAAEMNLTHFLVLDDDYSSILYRYVQDGKLKSIAITDFDKLAKDMCRFLDQSGAITVAMAQGGDFIGGAKNENTKKGITRKAMNVFFCRTDRPFKFYGRLNEDTTMYTYLGNKGKLIFTIMPVMITQQQTQKSAGGLTEMYLDSGTYVKSFYSVMWCPNCVKVSSMGAKHKRIHHKILWDYCTPKILSEKYKKKG